MMRHRFGQIDGPACSKPGYTRTLVSTGLFTLVWAPFALGGALIAATSDPKLKAALVAALKNQASPTTASATATPAEKAAAEKAAAEIASKVDMRRVIAGAVIGGAVGIVPALYAQRALLRTPECPHPGMGRLLAYNAIKYGAVGAAGYAGTRLWPAGGRSAARTVTAISMPLVGMALLKNNKAA